MNDINDIIKKYIETRDTRLRDKLVEHCMPIVDIIAENIAAKFSLELEEIQSIAYEELVKAVIDLKEKYLQQKSFNSYINYAVFNGLRNEVGKFTKMGSYDKLCAFENCKKIILAKVSAEKNENIDFFDHLELIDEIVDLMYEKGNVIDKKYMKHQLYIENALNLNSQTNLAYLCEEYADANVQVDQILSNVNERLRTILIYHYGLKGNKNMTCEEIGHMFGISRKRVSQIENKEFRKLRKKESAVRKYKKA